jgi:hypothetical protein
MKLTILAGFAAALSLGAMAAGAAQADPVKNIGHQIGKAGRATGHAVAATGRHVDHDIKGTSDYYNDHPGHAGYRMKHHRRHWHHRHHKH